MRSPPIKRRRRLRDSQTSGGGTEAKAPTGLRFSRKEHILVRVLGSSRLEVESQGHFDR